MRIKNIVTPFAIFGDLRLVEVGVGGLDVRGAAYFTFLVCPRTVSDLPDALVHLRMSLFTDYAVFLNIVQNAFEPSPPFLLNIW